MHPSDKFYCEVCKTVISEGKRHRHMTKRCKEIQGMRKFKSSISRSGDRKGMREVPSDQYSQLTNQMMKSFMRGALKPQEQQEGRLRAKPI